MFAQGNDWSLEIDSKLPIAILRVKGSPTGPDAMKIGEAVVGYAASIGNKPWAMVSDLREMDVATREGQEQWVNNMVNLMGLGLSVWAVINRKANAALQATMVSRTSKIQAITQISTEEAEAMEWARRIATVLDPMKG